MRGSATRREPPAGLARSARRGWRGSVVRWSIHPVLRPERDGDGPTGVIAPSVKPPRRSCQARHAKERSCRRAGRIGAGSPCFGAILGSASSSRSPSRPLSACWRRSSSRSAARIPGFFFSADFRIFPVDARGPRRPGSRTATGSSPWTAARPLSLMARVAAARGPIRYEVERDGRRFSRELAPATFTWHLFVGTSPPTSSCPRSCWRRGSSSSRRTPPRRSEPQLPRLHVSLGRVERGRARGRAGRRGSTRPSWWASCRRSCPCTAGSSS